MVRSISGFALLLWFSSATLCGCAGLIPFPDRDRKEQPVRFTSPDCARSFGGRPLLDEEWGLQKASLWEGLPVSGEIAGVVCADRLDADLSTLQGRISQLHFGFDDRRFDHLAAARMLTLCSAPKTVNGSSASFCEAQPIALGMMEWYATRLEAARLEQAITGLDLAPATRDAFIGRAMQAREEVLVSAGHLDPRRRELYVEVPNRSRQERQRYFHTHQALYARLDPLQEQARAAAGRKEAGWVKALVALRGEYFAGCKDAACKLDPFVTEVTRELVLFHALAQDTAAAELEFALIGDAHADLRGYGPVIWLAQSQALESETKQHRDYQDAVRSGTDGRLLEATYGNPPPLAVSPGVAWKPSLVFADLAAVSVQRRALKAFSGTVASVKKNGDIATVAFTDLVSVYDEIECWPTNRIAAIEYSRRTVVTPGAAGEGVSAKVRYEDRCETVGTKVERRKLPPVTIAASELGLLARGDVLQALAPEGGGAGGVVAVQRGGAVVQLRSHPIGR